MDVEDLAPALGPRLGPEAAAGMVGLFEATRQEWAAEVLSASVDRYESRLGREVGTLRQDLHHRDEALREEWRALELRLCQQLRAHRADATKWAVAVTVVHALITLSGWSLVVWLLRPG